MNLLKSIKTIFIFFSIFVYRWRRWTQMCSTDKSTQGSNSIHQKGKYCQINTFSLYMIPFFIFILLSLIIKDAYNLFIPEFTQIVTKFKKYCFMRKTKILLKLQKKLQFRIFTWFKSHWILNNCTSIKLLSTILF